VDHAALGDDDYRELLTLRNELRRFLRWSEQQAKAVGLTDAQHQLLLVIRGHPGTSGPSISDVADDLLLRHHSAVELVQRAEVAGYVTRRHDPVDRRLVRLHLSATGDAVLEKLSSLHAEELRRLAANPGGFSEGIDLRARRPPVASSAHVVDVCRVYDRPSADGGWRVLVDRLWPRGVRADEAPFDEWLSSVAPSSELRRWYDHDPARFSEFAQRYRAELHDQHAHDIDRLAELVAERPLTLVTASSEVAISAASVLADEIRSLLGDRTSP
jgi:uncharacterized protein YeaO (DUF488 family)/DNA-binding MarR family transcriptional regulator